MYILQPCTLNNSTGGYGSIKFNSFDSSTVVLASRSAQTEIFKLNLVRYPDSYQYYFNSCVLEYQYGYYTSIEYWGTMLRSYLKLNLVRYPDSYQYYFNSYVLEYQYGYYTSIEYWGTMLRSYLKLNLGPAYGIL